MPKSGHPGNWLQLWDKPNLDPLARLKAAMREALKGCPLSREQVVDEMNRLAGLEGIPGSGNSRQPVTPALLDKWVSPASAGHIVPLRLLPVFCQVVGSTLPVAALAAPLGASLVSGEDLSLLEWARTERKRKEYARRARRLAQEAGIE